MKFNNKAYDILKYVAQIGLPALATFIAAIGPVWAENNDLTGKTVTTIVAFNAFLGALLLISNVQYKKAESQ